MLLLPVCGYCRTRAGYVGNRLLCDDLGTHHMGGEFRNIPHEEPGSGHGDSDVFTLDGLLDLDLYFSTFKCIAGCLWDILVIRCDLRSKLLVYQEKLNRDEGQKLGANRTRTDTIILSISNI